jgi:hypothetical protein
MLDAVVGAAPDGCPAEYAVVLLAYVELELTA